MTVKKITSIGLMTAFLCIMAPWAIHIGPVPITLATFGLYLVSAVLGEKYATVSVVIYLILGAVGVPVFSGFTGGLQRLIGVTGGFLLADIPCAFIAGLGVRDGETTPVQKWRLPLFIVLGAAVLYAFGTAWFVIYKSALMKVPTGIGEALMACVVPFLPADVIKIAAATLLAWPIRRAIYR